MALRNRATVVHTFGRVPILEVSTTSFDHWRDQQRCLAECARVLEAKGGLVLADLFSPRLVATLIGGRREKARMRERLTPC
jgi:ubiquinone/menaquinone biosynthesis C-methylase UbiE